MQSKELERNVVEKIPVKELQKSKVNVKQEIYIHIYTHTHTHIHIHIYIHIHIHLHTYKHKDICKTFCNLFRDFPHPDPTSCGNQPVESY